MTSPRSSAFLSRFADNFDSFAAGQVIFAEGQAGNVLYVVKEGEVDILIHDQVIETIGPGDVLGEMALIDQKPRSATAVARTDCQLVPINEARFKFLVQQTPYFAIEVMRVMARTPPPNGRGDVTRTAHATG
jgi:CRP/FNR family cyclic AMP-dependent transcriptional regulator